MAKKAQRPVDLKDMLWSELGKDALDAAAERVWDLICDEIDADIYPYNWGSEVQITAQHVVLNVVGSTVPALLRERAKPYRGDPEYAKLYEQLRQLADEIENEHG